MKLSILQENLHQVITTAARAVNSRSTLPVMGNLLLEAAGDILTVSGHDLEIGIRTQTAAKVETPGAITVPARLFSELIGSLPPERIDLEGDEDTATLTLKCGTYRTTVKGISADEFPAIAELPDSPGVTFPGATLRRAIHLAIFAAATDQARPVFQGVLWQFTKDTLTLAAADGFRLSKVSRNGLSDITPGSSIIPAGALKEVYRLIDPEQPVIVYRDDRRAWFDTPAGLVTTTLINGEFPDYNRIIPRTYQTALQVAADDLAAALKLSRLFARDNGQILRLEITPAEGEELGRLSLFAAAAESGDCLALLKVRVEGPGLEIKFNCEYLKQAVEAIGSDAWLRLELTRAGNPGVLRDINDGTFVHVIMPMAG